jgi:hypothetical protein
MFAIHVASMVNFNVAAAARIDSAARTNMVKEPNISKISTAAFARQRRFSNKSLSRAGGGLIFSPGGHGNDRR